MPDIKEPLNLTSRGLEKALELAQQDEFKGKCLRLYIEGKGCDGFVYGVTFDELKSDDISVKLNEITLITDNETLVYVEGSTIDWVDDERGQGFLVSNPKQKQYRGKFYRKERWQEWLKERRDEIESKFES